MWLDVALAMSCGGSGVVCGWIMHAIGGFSNEKLVSHAAATVSSAGGTVTADPPTQQRITEVAERLKEHAVNMSADVDAHQSKMQAVNNSLIEGGENSQEAVLDAVNQLIAANQVMQSQLQVAQDRIHEQSEQLESAERRAHTDALTRIPNRGAFDAHIAQRHAQGADQAGTLALLDVDHFKKFNDVYGHLAGDEVLRVVASVLNARLKPHGLVARYGGEEFAMIMDGVSVEDAKSLMESARVAVTEREILFEDKRLRVTASIGVAELAEGETIEEWIARADSGLYHSKDHGRDCGHWMDSETPRLIEIGKQAKAKKKHSAASSKPKSTAAEEGEETPTSASVETEEPEEKDLGAFSGLLDLPALTEEYDEIRQRTQSNLEVFVMAVACPEEAPDATMRSLLQITRATLRSVDRLGCEDRSTLLICMPSVDQETAYQRGVQICRSAQSIGLTPQGPGENPIAIGVAQANESEDFGNAVARSLHLSKVARQEGADPVCLEGREAAV
ncbi:MAG: GGDEF domain-containing protein [Rubripirellula sp.]